MFTREKINNKYNTYIILYTYHWWLVVFKVRKEGLWAWLPLACFTVSGVWWNKYVRLKLF